MKNKRGYMLIEIILAFVLAIGIAFSIISLTIKLKNKNDEEVVETLISTDQAIISNKFMDYAINLKSEFDCSKIKISDNLKSISYNNINIDNLNKYTTFEITNSEFHNSDKYCKVDSGTIMINIPLYIPQLPDTEYTVNLNYKYQIGDKVPPEIKINIGEAEECTN